MKATKLFATAFVALLACTVAFTSCKGKTAPESDFTVTMLADGSGVEITKYTGHATKVVIPETIQGYPVKVIGWNAFIKNPTMTSVIIPEGVEYIKMDAFNGTLLSSITLPKSLKGMEAGAFAKCDRLEEINIPEDLTIYTIYGSKTFENYFSGTKIRKSLALQKMLKERTTIDNADEFRRLQNKYLSE